MRVWLCAAAVNGLLAVALGALAAHALAERLDPRSIGWIETGARYEMYHALALLAVAWLAGRGEKSPALLLAGWGFLLGCLLFSGTLYVMALSGAAWLGAVVPFGGVAFLAGWLGLFLFGLRQAAEPD